MGLTASQRIDALVDPGSALEIAAAARSQQPGVADETPRDGLLTAFATIGGQRVVVLAEDPIAAARTDSEVARRKRHRILTLASMTQTPVILVLDGADTIAPSFEDNTGELAGRMSDPRIDIDLEQRVAPLLSVVCGPIVAWARDVVAASDVVIATRAAAERLSPTFDSFVDVVVDDDDEAMSVARSISSLLAADDRGQGALRFMPARVSETTPFDLAALSDPAKVVAFLTDAHSVIEMRRPEASGLVTGLARIGGWPVVVAATGGDDSARLSAFDLTRLRRAYCVAARAGLTLIAVQDCVGFAPDAALDLGGRAALTNAIRACDSPVISIVSGAGHTLGTFPLGTKQLGTSFIIAWPWSRLATTEARDYTPEHLDAIRRPDPWLAAGRGLVDDVLTPEETVHTVRQLVALFGERWRTTTPAAPRPNAVSV